MRLPLLATKLYVPATQPELVARPRLLARLDAVMQRKLTLISAPTGFGKTTLVQTWLSRRPYPRAWLTLDAGDNDLSRFLTYLVIALRQLVERQAHGERAAEFGAQVLAALNSPPPVPTEPLLITLINDIAAHLVAPFVLVLDDYHVINEERPTATVSTVSTALTFLLDHMPPNMHVLLTTRRDPALPLARLRARGQLVELRSADLRFHADEAATFFNQTMALALTTEQIAALEERTEGWVALLQLSALALRGQAAAADLHAADRFIASFAGSHQFVLDYLVEEIVQQQPAAVQAALLRTSILDQVCVPLCDALAPSAAAPGLDALIRTNLPLVPLDDRRTWYRYHHLFGDVLRTYLQRRHPEWVADLHRRASAWYDAHDHPYAAIRHALAAEDFAHAATLIEQIWSTIRRSCFRSPSWLGWVQALPYEMVRARPVLTVGYAWELLNFGEIESAEAVIQDCTHLLNETAPEGAATAPIVTNTAELPTLPALLAVIRAAYAQAHGDSANTIRFARRALALVTEDDPLTRGIASSYLGIELWKNGDLETAYAIVVDAMSSFRRAGNVAFVLNDVFFQTEIRLAQGRLRDAAAIYEQALRQAIAPGRPPAQGAANLYAGLAVVRLEQGDMAAAEANLRQSTALGETAGLPDWRFRHALAAAQYQMAGGAWDDALTSLTDVEQLYSGIPVPLWRPPAVLQARLWIAQGQLAQARRWIEAQGLAAEDALHYLREAEHITLAHLLLAELRLAQNDGAALVELLRRLLDAAESGGRTAHTIEILILQALAQHARGDTVAALPSLQRALTLAEPERFVERFLAEGAPLQALLQRLDERDAHPYATDLLAHFARRTGRSPGLVEKLTAREQEVLRLIATGLSNPEIAAELVIALTTVKTHTKNLYGKLQVSNRVAAVARARELGLL